MHAFDGNAKGNARVCEVLQVRDGNVRGGKKISAELCISK